LQKDYEARNLQILEVAEGFQLCTRTEFGEWIKTYLKLDKTSKLSQPALDTLSIIAYKQPLTRAEVDEIRGVDSAGVVKTLLEKKVICPSGRKKVPGRPVMYSTTRKFLEYFGLKDLGDLPTLEDFKESDLGDGLPKQTQLLFTEKEPESHIEPATQEKNIETIQTEDPATHEETA
ncbi:MAG: SMC-Scp complex subunit ScpB, partial [Nitrospinae bacterium RIFCSPLOWO2_12_FULL_47_7]